MFYKFILKPILFKFNPETVHNLFIRLGVFLGKYYITRRVIWIIYGYKGKNISTVVDGIRYNTPIILSAGFDYNANLTQILPSLGFGGVEVGSVTARPCLGNPSPTLTRLPISQAIIVHKGLKNDGVDAIIKRLKSTPREKGFVIGVSIAKTNDRENCDVDEAIKDYCYSFKRLNEENIGDYYTLNISCPNSFGGEAFTTPSLLEKLLIEIRKIDTIKPVYIKMPISLPWIQIKELLEVITKYKINGVIIGNLNKNYENISNKERPSEYRGGISGKPCFILSNELIKKTRENFGDKLTIIGCGGIFTPSDAKLKFEAGSKLIQLATGMIYNGPGIINKICKTIQKEL